MCGVGAYDRMMVGRYSRRVLKAGGALVHVAFGVGLRAQVLWSLFCGVGHALVQVGQGDGVLLVDVALKLSLQAGSLIVGERQRDEGLGLTHELVNVALPRHLER